MRRARLSISCALALSLACGGTSGGDTSSDDTAGDDTTAGPSSASAEDGPSPTSSSPTDDGSSTGATTSGDDDSTTGAVVPDECSAEEAELVELVNLYRAEHGLPAVPLSPSLCIVGHTHAEDLAIEQPQMAGPECNLHSWSDAGPWTPCCYTPDHAQAECMWQKPAELTSYPGFGYENSASGGGMLTPAEALDIWQNSPPHDAVILNEGTWADHPWGAVGAGMFQGYAVLWFGEEPDPLAP
ncbi:MAG: hypothetical protein KDK70_31135 [Myxococcales bacterium]|nr:hypothetical protein [Myxococcales bacterium]